MRPLGILFGAICLALGTGAFAGAPPPPPPPAAALDPAVEEILAFVTDTKGLTKLRHKRVVARLAKVIPMKMTTNEPDLWRFEGTAGQGPVAYALIGWDGSETFRDGQFRLRTDKPVALAATLAGRVQQKLGKPRRTEKDGAGQLVAWAWTVGTDWDIIVAVDDKAKGGAQVVVDVDEYREPEEFEP